MNFGKEVQEVQETVIDNYIHARGWEQYAEAREVLYACWEMGFSQGRGRWDTNLPEWLAAMRERGFVDADGMITLYRGWENDGLAIEERQHTSWTWDRNVAVWHASCFKAGELVSVRIPATIEEFEWFTIWASDTEEAELMVQGDEMMGLWELDWKIEPIEHRVGEDACSLSDYLCWKQEGLTMAQRNYRQGESYKARNEFVGMLLKYL